MLKYSQQRKAGVEKHDRICNEVSLILHLQDADEYSAGRVGAPEDGNDDEDVSDQRIKIECYAAQACEDERKETVSQYRRDTIRAYSQWRHEIEEHVEA